MKILQLGKYYFPTFGGIETVVQDLSEGLMASGNEVTVLCAGHTWARSIENIRDIPVIREPCLGTLLSQPLTPLLPYSLRMMASDFDLVHLHSPNPIAEIAALMNHHIGKSTPLLVTYHSDVVRQRLLLPFYQPFLIALLNRAQAIAVPTEYHIAHSPILSRFREKCRIAPFGIVSSRYAMNPAARDLAKELRKNYGRFLLFVGRLVKYKGLAYLIQAMTKVDAHLVILGEGPLLPSLKSLAQALGVLDRVHFQGKIGNQDVLNAHYSACELFVLPSISKNEAYGMVLLEAMAFAKPVITTQIPSGVRWVNQEGITGLSVPPEDSQALAQAIQELLHDDIKREQMGRAAFNRFQKVFTAEKMVESYQAIYREIRG